MDRSIYQTRNTVGPPSEVPRSSQYMFRGAVIGLVAGIVALFAASTAYAAVAGYDPVNCAVLGSFMTVTLSQPVGLAGLLVGSVCGGICAMVAHWTDKAKGVV